MENPNWQILNMIVRTPAYIQELKPFELEEIALMIEHIQNGIISTWNKLLIANPERDDIKLSNFSEWRRMEFLEGILKAENERRGGVVVAPKSKPAPPPAEPMPAFEQVYKGSLLDLWGKLSTMPKPIVSKSGNFIWTGENVSVLMALAQALLTADRIEGKRNAESVYRILCAHFGEEPAERQRAVPKNGIPTYVYTDYLAAFNDLFQDLD